MIVIEQRPKKANISFFISVALLWIGHPASVFAAPAACGEQQAVESIQDIAASSFNTTLLLFMGEKAQKVIPSEFVLKDTYTESVTEDVRSCIGTLSFLKESAEVASAEIHYQIVTTDEGTDLLKWARPLDELAPFVQSIVTAKKPSNEALQEYYAPQGPGSSAAENRAWNQNHNASGGRRKQPPQE